MTNKEQVEKFLKEHPEVSELQKRLEALLWAASPIKDWEVVVGLARCECCNSHAFRFLINFNSSHTVPEKFSDEGELLPPRLTSVISMDAVKDFESLGTLEDWASATMKNALEALEAMEAEGEIDDME